MKKSLVRKFLLIVVIFCIVTTNSGCSLQVGNIQPPSGMPKCVVDIEASEITTNVLSAQNMRTIATDFLNKWCEQYGQGSEAMPARFRLNYSDTVTMVYPWLFVFGVNMILPIGQAETKMNVDFQIGKKLYSGSSNLEYFFGCFYSRPSQISKALELSVKNAIINGKITNYANQGETGDHEDN